MSRETESAPAPPAPEAVGGRDPETPEIRLRRLRMRSARRGMREMDLILGGFAEARLVGLPPAALDGFESILSENDQDLYHWLSGRGKAPEAHAAIIARIRDYLARG